MKKIVVLGGSFNPPTKAHIELLNSAVEQLGAEFGIFVPSSNNYVSRKISKHDRNSIVFSEQTRFEMLNEICSQNDKLIVDTCEYGDDGRGHTYDTLCKIQEKYPTYKIMFVVGADKLTIIPRWRNSEQLLNKFEFAVIKRNDVDMERIIKDNPILSKHKEAFYEVDISDSIADISSTTARRAIKEKNKEKLKSILHETTLKFV